MKESDMSNTVLHWPQGYKEKALGTQQALTHKILTNAQ